MDQQLPLYAPELMSTPFAWSLDEANQYLFTQIENDFAFGEGGLQQWSPDDVLNNNQLADFVYTGLNG